MEYSVTDVVVAVATAAGVMGGAALVLRASALGANAAAPEIDVGAGVPVRVVPVLDLDAPTLKLGGGRARAGLPQRWIRRPKAVADSKASPPPAATSSSHAPSSGVAAADAGAPGDTDAGATADSDAGAPGETGVDTGAGAEPGPGGPGHPLGAPEGTETDPLKARAGDVYRSRLVAWFSSRFRVSGSGLPQSTLTKLRVQATVQISPDRRVAGYTMTSSGNGVFDAAARAALESAKGQELPPPPESYPDLFQTTISLTFVCKEGRCD